MIHSVKTVISQQRETGFEGETNDCFVFALRAITKVPYRDAHAFVAKRFGRKPRKATMDVGSKLREIDANREYVFGFRAFNENPVCGTRLRRSRRYGYIHVPVYQTLVQFVRTHRTGSYLCCSISHAFAVIDGVVHDNGPAGDRSRVALIYRMIESSKCGGNI